MVRLNINRCCYAHPAQRRRWMHYQQPTPERLAFDLTIFFYGGRIILTMRKKKRPPSVWNCKQKVISLLVKLRDDVNQAIDQIQAERVSTFTLWLVRRVSSNSKQIVRAVISCLKKVSNKKGFFYFPQINIIKWPQNHQEYCRTRQAIRNIIRQ